MPDRQEATTARRDPGADKQSVWSGKGQYRRTPHSDRTNKCDQSWGRSKVKAVYSASDRLTGTIIPVNILGQVACEECGYVPTYTHNGRLACECTVWNEGAPRPNRAATPMPKTKRESQWRDVAKGRC